MCFICNNITNLVYLSQRGIHVVAGVVALQESVLEVVEKKQEAERDLLMELVAATDQDPEMKEMVQSIQTEVNVSRKS